MSTTNPDGASMSPEEWSMTPDGLQLGPVNPGGAPPVGETGGERQCECGQPKAWWASERNTLHAKSCPMFAIPAETPLWRSLTAPIRAPDGWLVEVDGEPKKDSRTRSRLWESEAEANAEAEALREDGYDARVIPLVRRTPSAPVAPERPAGVTLAALLPTICNRLDDARWHVARRCTGEADQPAGNAMVAITDAITVIKHLRDAAPVAPAGRQDERAGIYVASRTRHAAMWRAYRDEGGVPIVSTWIDEAGEGETSDWADLWRRCEAEIKRAEVLVAYAVPDDVLRGAFVEVGFALAHGTPVIFVGPDSAARNVLKHPSVKRAETFTEATRSIPLRAGRQDTAATDEERSALDWLKNGDEFDNEKARVIQAMLRTKGDTAAGPNTNLGQNGMKMESAAGERDEAALMFSFIEALRFVGSHLACDSSWPFSASLFGAHWFARLRSVAPPSALTQCGVCGGLELEKDTHFVVCDECWEDHDKRPARASQPVAVAPASERVWDVNFERLNALDTVAWLARRIHGLLVNDPDAISECEGGCDSESCVYCELGRALDREAHTPLSRLYAAAPVAVAETADRSGLIRIIEAALSAPAPAQPGTLMPSYRRGTILPNLEAPAQPPEDP